MTPSARIHYGWVIVGTGTLGIFACLGFGRFALGMLLPSMGASLHLSPSQLGFVSTGNFLGYLAAVLAAGTLADRFGPRALVSGALVLIGLSMLLVSRVEAFASLLLLYAVTGLGSGATNVPVMGLIARWFERRRRGRAAGFAVIGSGFAIVVSGQLIPWVNRLEGAEGWRANWVVLGVAVLVIAAISALLLRNRPEDLGLEPVGSDAPAAVSDRPASPPGVHHRRNPAVYLLGAIYAIFGFTYAIYVTFVVTMLVQERGFSEATAGRFWSAVGLLSLLSGPVFGGLSDRLGRRAGLAIVFGLQLLAYLLAGARLPDGFLFLSVACFGVVAWSVPSIMVAAVGDQVGPEQALAALGFLTFFFGIGQIAGPAVAGVLAERHGSFSPAFLLAAVLAGVAIALCRWLHGPRARGPDAVG